MRVDIIFQIVRFLFFLSTYWVIIQLKANDYYNDRLYKIIKASNVKNIKYVYIGTIKM